MKRSQMVEKLALSVSVISGGLYTKKEALEIASDLLKQMEDEGMLPPKLKVESTAFVTNPETGERGEFTSWTYRNKWEPEDGQHGS